MLPQSSPSLRKTPRYRCNQKLCIRYSDGKQEFIVMGRVTVISKGGVGAQLPTELAVGQTATLEIALGNVAPRWLKAEVSNRRGLLYGFRFAEDERAAASLTALFQSDNQIHSVASRA